MSKERLEKTLKEYLRAKSDYERALDELRESALSVSNIAQDFATELRDEAEPEDDQIKREWADTIENWADEWADFEQELCSMNYADYSEPNLEIPS